MDLLSNFDEIEILFISIFSLSILFGVFARKTDFCPLGGIADVVRSGNTGRLSMYFFAIAVAMFGVTVLEAIELIAADGTRPPYRMSQFRWPAYLVGGAFFGVGMTLCRGCGMKSILNLGGGNLKSLVSIAAMGFAAVLMLYAEGFFNDYFLSWVLPVSPDLDDYGMPYQDLGTISGSFFEVDVSVMRIVVGILLSTTILYFVFSSKDFAARKDNVIGGFAVGALIVAAFYISGGPIGELANEASDFSDMPQNGMGTQSYTFIRPMGDLLYIAANPEWYVLTFGLVAFIGVGVGSVLISIFSSRFQLVWFSSIKELFRYAAGGMMVGIGGILGMGCTLGQGVAGVSTLSLGSFVDLFALMVGAYFGIRMQKNFMLDHDVPKAD